MAASDLRGRLAPAAQLGGVAPNETGPPPPGPHGVLRLEQRDNREAGKSEREEKIFSREQDREGASARAADPGAALAVAGCTTATAIDGDARVTVPAGTRK